jgi:HSP20 family molecular chaperone IbpA
VAALSPDISQEAAHPTKKQPWHDTVTLGERRIGAGSRRFLHLHAKSTTRLHGAKLRDGLLSIVVPKVKHNIELGGKLAID